MINPVLLGVLVGIIGQIILFGVAWGTMQSEMKNTRQRQDERHAENQEVLHEIRDDVKRINGTVARHAATLEHHAKEIDRLRGRQ